VKTGKYILLGGIFILFIFLSGCQNAFQVQPEASPKQITITDSSGAKVEIPAQIKRIGDAWPAHNEVVCMLGAGDKIVATTAAAAQRPWMRVINPQMSQAVTAFDNTGVNLETLMAAKPDIVFTPLNNKSAQRIADLKIPVVQLMFNDFDSLKECFRLTGVILGGEAKQRAEKYIAYLDYNLNRITGITAGIPREQKPKVLHITRLAPLMVDGNDSIINAWITVAGGINAADSGGEVSMEQMITWNPDVIIFGNTALAMNGVEDGAKALKEILHDEKWRRFKAVQTGNVHINPEGAFFWDRYGAEEALQIQWAAKILHPDKFQDIDIAQETQYFYRTFLNYDLSAEEANRMIAGKPPVR
jgi:iron complex transport system substrate-binding protein